MGCKPSNDNAHAKASAPSADYPGPRRDPPDFDRTSVQRGQGALRRGKGGWISRGHSLRLHALPVAPSGARTSPPLEIFVTRDPRVWASGPDTDNLITMFRRHVPSSGLAACVAVQEFPRRTSELRRTVAIRPQYPLAHLRHAMTIVFLNHFFYLYQTTALTRRHALDQPRPREHSGWEKWPATEPPSTTLRATSFL